MKKTKQLINGGGYGGGIGKSIQTTPTVVWWFSIYFLMFSVFILIIIIGIIFFLIFKPNFYKNHIFSQSLLQQPISSITQITPTNECSKLTYGLNNPYAPPLKNINGCSLPFPVNVETRYTRSNYSQVGILMAENKNNNENLILPLMGRKIQRDKWQYYSISNTGNFNTKLPIRYKGKSCTTEYGCDEIMNGDDVFVEGYNNIFHATIYENCDFQYNI